MNWHTWLMANGARLRNGETIEAPSWLPTPALAGFYRIAIASPVGQRADWGLSLPDGSRYHVHEFANGRRQVHRDKHDPAQGLGKMVAHLATETYWGILIAIGAFAVANAKEG